MKGLRGYARGYALVIALIMIATASYAALVAVTGYQTELQRERESQLLFAGDQYRRALQSYAAVASAGGLTQYPQHLEDMLEDKRFPNPVRHLRQMYVDPMTGAADWQLELQQGRIIGVHSRSTRAPLRHANFPERYAAFADAHTYADWHFTAASSSTAAAAKDSAPGATQPGLPATPAAPSQMNSGLPTIPTINTSPDASPASSK